MANPRGDFENVLRMSGLVIPLWGGGYGKRQWLMARQVPGREKTWLKAVQAMLEKWGEETEKGTELVIARRYILKNKKMVFGWYISVEHKSAAEVKQVFANLIEVVNGFAGTFEAEPEDEPAPQPTAKAQKQGKRPTHLQATPANIASQTTARPRPPEGTPDPVAPQNYVPRAKLVTTGPNGAKEVIEMPLPHVYGELNRPASKDPGAKGARAIK